MQQLLSSSPADTEDLATRIGHVLRAGDCVFLRGDLGMGKSVFARALIRFLCDDQGMDVPSPTFTLIQTYDTDRGALWHFDLYRIKAPDEIWELGWEEARSGGIIVVEWPERMGNGLAPANRLEIEFSTLSNNQETNMQGQRQITLTPYGTWKDRL